MLIGLGFALVFIYGTDWQQVAVQEPSVTMASLVSPRAVGVNRFLPQLPPVSGIFQQRLPNPFQQSPTPRTVSVYGGHRPFTPGQPAYQKADSKWQADNPVPDIKKQVEYYLSDENLKYDGVFQKKIKADSDGWLPIDYILQSNRMKMMHATKEHILEAMKDSDLEVNGDQTALRRPGNPALPELTPWRRKVKEVYVEKDPELKAKMDKFDSEYEALSKIVDEFQEAMAQAKIAKEERKEAKRKMIAEATPKAKTSNRKGTKKKSNKRR